MPEFQSLASDPRVYSIDGPLCRWSMKARRSNNKEEFMRKQTRWLTSSKEISVDFVETDDANMIADTST